jgi:hypothetical protein
LARRPEKQYLSAGPVDTWEEADVGSSGDREHQTEYDDIPSAQTAANQIPLHDSQPPEPELAEFTPARQL